MEESATVTVFYTRISIYGIDPPAIRLAGSLRLADVKARTRCIQSRAILADERTTSIAKTMSATLDGIIGHSTVMQRAHDPSSESRAARLHRSNRWRIRYRQGTHSPLDSREFQARKGTFRATQLWSNARRSYRIHSFRSRERFLHWCLL